MHRSPLFVVGTSVFLLLQFFQAAEAIALCLPSSSPETQLALAAKTDDSQKVTALLNARVDPNQAWSARDGGQCPAIVWAAPNETIFDALVKAGASVHMAVQGGKKDGFTALHSASCIGSARTVEHLLNAGMPADGAGKIYSPLIHAAGCAERKGADHITVIRMLLTRGAKVSLAAENGWTALHAAAERNFVARVEALLEFHPNHDLVDTNGQTPLMVAARGGAMAVVRLLVERARVNLFATQTTDGKNAAQIAQAKGHSEVAAYLTTAMAQSAPEHTTLPVAHAVPLTHGSLDYDLGGVELGSPLGKGAAARTPLLAANGAPGGPALPSAPYADSF